LLDERENVLAVEEIGFTETHRWQSLRPHRSNGSGRGEAKSVGYLFCCH